jgi:PAS domain S-box-containing protein
MGVKMSPPLPRTPAPNLRAEAELARAPPAKAKPRSDDELLHDLQVYQIELEMQNEALRQSQVALEESRDRYVDLYEFAPIGYLTLTESGLISQVNLTGAALLGEERSKLLNRSFARFVAASDRDKWHRHSLHVFQHGGKQTCELVLHRHDGTVFDACLDTMPTVADAAGPTLRIALTDVSERKQAARALAESEARFRRLFEANGSIMLLIDPSTGAIAAANQAASAYYGYPSQRLAGMLISHINTLPADETTLEWQRALREERNCFNFRHRLASGEERNVEVYSAPVDVGGRPMLFSIVHDITERKRAEDALHEAKAKAEQATLAKSKFLAAASHDLRQPVQALVLLIARIEAAARGTELERPLRFMEQAITALNTMLNSILDISRLEAAAVTANCETFDIGEMVRRLGEDSRPQADHKSLRFSVRAPSLGVCSDIALVERTLRNLIENALRYTERGGVVLGCRRRAGEVRIDVVDSGVGIAEQHLASIFEEFFQVDNDARERTKGLGLGLSIVKRLVDLIGGRLEVRSQPGRGSRFSLFLPAADLPARLAPMPPLPDGGGKLVVLVEDDELVRASLHMQIESWGFRVIGAADGTDAVNQISQLGEVPDAILADYRLCNGETGPAVAHRLRSIFGVDIPTVVLTGDTSPELIGRFQESGLDILHKPVTSLALRLAITSLVGLQVH